MATGVNPPVYTTDVGLVRLLGNDNYYDPTTGYLFSDDAVSAFLTVGNNRVKRAAALMLRAIAADEALVTRVIRTDDLSVNGATTAEALRKLAEDLDAQDRLDQDNALADAFTVVYPEDPSWYQAEAAPLWLR